MSEPEIPAAANDALAEEPVAYQGQITVKADLDAQVISLNFTVPATSVLLDAHGARALVEAIMRAGQRIGQHNAPRIVAPDARHYAKRPLASVVHDAVNGSHR